MKRLLVSTRLIPWIAIAFFANAAQGGLITFDTDAGGSPLVEPCCFVSTVALTTLYAPLGVTFSGPGGNDGGAILDTSGNFGVSPVSGSNFLAFNRSATMSDGGTARDPETITFASPVSSASIFAAGGFSTGNFLMEAFDATSTLVDSDSVATLLFAQLSVSGAGIVRLVLTETNGINSFVYDNLEFNGGGQVPEPGSLALLGIALAALAGKRKGSGT